MTMYLRRRASFSAGYGKTLGGGVGRGHDFLCELTVGGQIDPRTGMVVNIKDMDAVLQAKIVGPLGGKLLDTDVAAFRDLPATPENLARFIWGECRAAWLPQAKLARVSLWPHSLLRVELSAIGRNENNPMLSVTRTYDFSASHRLHSTYLSDEENAEIFGKCNWANGHGHNYDVEVTFTGEPDPRTGQLVSLDRLDEVVERVVLKPYDHRHLNYDTAEFRDLNPTSENLTRVIWDNLARHFAATPWGTARLYKVAVRETARNYFEYYGGEE